MSADSWTVAAALAEGRRRLTAAGIDDAAVDSRRLLSFVIDISPTSMLARPDRVLSQGECERYLTAISRRVGREPVSRIVEQRGFFGRDYIVTPDVLDPRPDTETVVDAALRVLRERAETSAAPRILDIGTGSGCILISILAAVPEATGTGLDISAAALGVARRNAERHGVADRADFVSRDLYGRSLPEGHRIWVSNPPYIPSDDIASLDPEVREHDPLVALDGGADGFDAYRAILEAAKRAEGPRAIILEVGAGQAHDVRRLAVEFFGPAGIAVSTSSDLGGIVRCVTIQLHGR